MSYSVPLYNNENKENKNDPYQNNYQMKFKSNDEVLKKRTEELEKVKKISSQVASITDKMKFKIDEQGIMLNDIEGNIQNFEENVEKGFKEIKKTEFKSKKKKKRIHKLWIAILILSLIIVFYCYRIFN